MGIPKIWPRIVDQAKPSLSYHRRRDFSVSILILDTTMGRPKPRQTSIRALVKEIDGGAPFSTNNVILSLVCLIYIDLIDIVNSYLPLNIALSNRDEFSLQG